MKVNSMSLDNTSDNKSPSGNDCLSIVNDVHNYFNFLFEMDLNGVPCSQKSQELIHNWGKAKVLTSTPDSVDKIAEDIFG